MATPHTRSLTLALLLTPTLALAQAPSPVAHQSPILEETSVAEQQASMKNGTISARSLTEYYLSRIKDLDPKLRSVLETNPDALSIAEALDAERKAKGPRGPLHGIPVLLKDNIATFDKLQTTAGSLALVGIKPPRDSRIVERLRQAGAVILGKTNLSEWANIRSDRSSSGWSARGGQARNPYALDRSPCGSSSGTGVAISANLASVGVGTETDGSILCPSGVNGLVGLKPTVGLVSQSGIIPISHTQDTAGPMTRSVADAAALLSVLAEGPHAEADYTKGLDAYGLKGARIGIARKKVFGTNPAMDRVAEAAIVRMKAMGAIIVDPADIDALGEYDAAEFDVLLFELKNDLAAYLKEWAPGGPQSLEDIIKFNAAHADTEMPFFGQELFEKAAKLGPLTDKRYKAALEKCKALGGKKGVSATLARHKLDALVMPTNGPAWLIDLVAGDHYTGGNATPAAVPGLPSITVPAGDERGLPIGITFIGAPWSEAKLLKLAFSFEQGTKARRAPKMLPSVALPVTPAP